jgi:hypothetical protein
MRIRAVVTTAVSLGAVVVASQAPGQDFPGTNDLTGTDGRYVTGCWNDSGSIPAELSSHWNNYLAGTIASQTNLTFSMGSCDGTTDLAFDDNLTDDDYMGQRYCTKIGGSFGWTASTEDMECDQARIRLNPDEIDRRCAGMNLSDVYRKMWCHESGHGLGLGHYWPGCMLQGCSGLWWSYAADQEALLAIY